MTFSNHTLTLVALIAGGLSVLSIALVIAGGAGKRSSEPKHLAGDEAVGALLGRIERIENAVRTLNQTDKRQQVLVDGSIRRVALLRYDAFDDVGGRLSFSCALLDEHGTGMVLTSINGRQETRVYAKPVANGTSSYNLSEEEEEAIRRAMAGDGQEAVNAR